MPQASARARERAPERMIMIMTTVIRMKIIFMIIMRIIMLRRKLKTKTIGHDGGGCGHDAAPEGHLADISAPEEERAEIRQ